MKNIQLLSKFLRGLSHLDNSIRDKRLVNQFLMIIAIMLLSLSSYGQSLHTEPVFTIGTKWTYNYTRFAIPEISFIDFTISDTFTRNDSLIYTIKNNRNLPDILMYQDGQKIYLVDPFTNL